TRTPSTLDAMVIAAGSTRKAAYWILVGSLLGFGMLAIFSIGAPFFLLGLTLAVVAPWRHRRGVLWPAGGSGAWLRLRVPAVLPDELHDSDRSCATPGRCPQLPGECNTAFRLFHYGSASPSLIPTLVAGLALAVLAAAAVNRTLARRPRS